MAEFRDRHPRRWRNRDGVVARFTHFLRGQQVVFDASACKRRRMTIRTLLLQRQMNAMRERAGLRCRNSSQEQNTEEKSQNLALVSDSPNLAAAVFGDQQTAVGHLEYGHRAAPYFLLIG